MNDYPKRLAITLCGAIGLLPGCKKSFLDKEPISQSTVGNYYKTASDAEGGLVGVYQQAFLSDAVWIYDYTTNGDSRADNSFPGSNNSDNLSIGSFTVNTSNGAVQRDWQSPYQDIYAANTVLDYVPKIPASQFVGNRQQQILGEAKFIRALDYFQLVTTYGAVPLILSTITFPAQPTRSAVNDVYTQIENDLTFADSVLPVSTPKVGHATQGAVEALLAKVYAQEGKYQQCATYCAKVISNGQYALVPNFSTLFDGTKNTSESIFEIQHAAPNFLSYNVSLYLPEIFGTYSFPKFNIPTQDLINLYLSQGDSIRLNSSIYTGAVVPSTCMVAGDPIPPPYSCQSPTVPFIYKWKHNIAPFTGGTDNTILLRLADIILLEAEALNQLGQTPAAIPLVNQIRARVHLPPITATSQADVALAILTERRMELAFEGFRWNDLLRYGIPYLIALKNSQTDPFGNSLNLNVTADKLLFPVPITEIQLDANLKQNPGY